MLKNQNCQENGILSFHNHQTLKLFRQSPISIKKIEKI